MATNVPSMPDLYAVPDSATSHFNKDGKGSPRSSGEHMERQAEQMRAQPSVPRVETATVSSASLPLVGKPPGTHNAKPVTLWIPTTNFSSRNQVLIKSIWIHSASVVNSQQVTDWFQDSQSHVSGHYVIGWSGQLIQLVADDFAAWHLAGENANSISIDVCATEDQVANGMQGASLVSLVLWLIAEYLIAPEDIKTDAPFLFQGYADSFERWKEENFSSIAKIPEAASPLPEGSPSISG